MKFDIEDVNMDMGVLLSGIIDKVSGGIKIFNAWKHKLVRAVDCCWLFSKTFEKWPYFVFIRNRSRILLNYDISKGLFCLKSRIGMSCQSPHTNKLAAVK